MGVSRVGRRRGRLREARRERGAAGGPLWRKAPLALVRYPGLLGAVLAGALLLSLVSASYPLFLSRSEGKLLAAELSDPTIERYGAGLFYSATNIGFRERARGGGNLVERIHETLTDVERRAPYLDRPIRLVLGATAEVTLPGGRSARSGEVTGALFFGDGDEAQVEMIDGDRTDGAILPDIIAGPLGVEPGDSVELHTDGLSKYVTLRVGGVYRSLYSQPRSGYWSPWSEQIYQQCPFCPAPPQFILVDPDEVIDLSRRLGFVDADFGWVLPVVDRSLTVDEAETIETYVSGTIDEASRRGTGMWRVLDCCGTSYGHGGVFFGRRDIEFRSSMPLVLREVERHAAALEGPLRLLLIAGLGVAAAVVAAAAAFAVAGRRTEAALLHARGWGPVRFATKSMIEAAIPTVAGAAVGLGLGWLLVSTFGPPAPAAASAGSASILAAAAAGAAALVVLGLVSAVSFIRTFEVHALKRRLAWVPWELFAIGGALWVLSLLRAGGALIEDPVLDIQRPSAFLLAFPVLFVVGFATLGARLLVEALRRAGSRIGGSSSVSYLAVHRLTGLPRLTVLLVGAAALCLGVFVNGQTLVRSLRATVDAKAGVFVGSDVQVLIDYTAPEQDRFPLPITRSTRLKYAGRLLPGDTPFDLLGIDAETIVGAAYWDGSFSDEPLAELVARLRSNDGPLPVLLVQGGGEPSVIDTAQVELPIEVVGRADAFPGVSSDDPVVVVDVASLDRRLGDESSPLRSANARTEYWIAGDTDEALAAVAELEAYPLGTITLEEVKDVPFVRAAIETFAMLNLLGLAAALLVVGVLVVYLQARQRARTVSNVLSLRMGMRDRQALRALVLELGAMLVAAFVLGAALGLVAGFLVAPLLDPLPTIPPAPLFRTPAVVVAGTLVGILLVALVGGWLVHRRASAVDLGEVLRVAE